MEEVKLYCAGVCRGTVALRPEGVRTEVRVAMEDPGDGLYRASLVGERGELPLGVLEPEGPGRLGLLRRPYSRDMAAIGPPVRGEARCSFPFREDAWQAAERPGRLFQSPFLRTRLEGVSRAWRRERGGLLLLAIPLEEDGPFPLEALFCLARVERVAGTLCAVFAFQGEEPAGVPWDLARG